VKAVIDTNVFVSSFFGGKPREIIGLWRKGRLTLCLSKSILNEYLDVMERLKLERELLADLMGLFSRGCNLLFSQNTPSLKVVKDDPDDDKFIECALALGAEYIISGDSHLPDVKQYGTIRIMNPAQFLEEVSGDE
jgi:putative PIN family toxin of toxin-antitoxin system